MLKRCEKIQVACSMCPEVNLKCKCLHTVLAVHPLYLCHGHHQALHDSVHRAQVTHKEPVLVCSETGLHDNMANSQAMQDERSILSLQAALQQLSLIQYPKYDAYVSSRKFLSLLCRPKDINDTYKQSTEVSGSILSGQLLRTIPMPGGLSIAHSVISYGIGRT